MAEERIYAAIDLRSFYASVECRERGLDPLDTNLVVADESRTDKTVCLAVSPSLKSHGISGRGRLYEVKEKVKQVNALRRGNAPGRTLEGASCLHSELQANPNLALDFIIAPPRMALYMQYSVRIIDCYRKYVDATHHLVTYSIDEVFLDLTNYLSAYRCTAKELVTRIIQDVYETTGITATAGIGTNLFLCKVAMDILGKHVPPDENGVRIAELDEMSYRKQLWDHRPITDFWRVGRGYARKLESRGIYTMGDLARLSIVCEDQLYKMFGKNAELLIDHAWGWEPCTMEHIKAYKPSNNSLGSGQVLHQPYETENAKLVLREMADALSLDLVEKGLVTDQIVVTVGYDKDNLTDPMRSKLYTGPVVTDHYGRAIPKHAHGTKNLGGHTSSTRRIMNAATSLFDRIVDPNLLVRRLNISANHVVPEGEAPKQDTTEQLDLFVDYEKLEQERVQEQEELEREKKLQKALLAIRQKHGKNAILKAASYQDGATARDSNAQIGGHKA